VSNLDDAIHQLLNDIDGYVANRRTLDAIQDSVHRVEQAAFELAALAVERAAINDGGGWHGCYLDAAAAIRELAKERAK
jgi:hypothetical protein